jgi:hypothetical protein
VALSATAVGARFTGAAVAFNLGCPAPTLSAATAGSATDNARCSPTPSSSVIRRNAANSAHPIGDSGLSVGPPDADGASPNQDNTAVVIVCTGARAGVTGRLAGAADTTVTAADDAIGVDSVGLASAALGFTSPPISARFGSDPDRVTDDPFALESA